MKSLSVIVDDFHVGGARGTVGPLEALDANDAGLDFADALHLASTPDVDAFFTFDRRLARAAPG